MTLPLLLAKSAISLLKYIAKAMPTKKRVQGSAKPIGSVTYLADLVQKALGMNSFPIIPSASYFFLEEFLQQDFWRQYFYLSNSLSPLSVSWNFFI
mgnify:CR=1 FL=1